MKDKHGGGKLTEILFRQRILTPDEEKILAAAIHSGDRKMAEKAFDRLVLSNVRFAISIAREYLRSGVEFEDLVSEAVCGLMDGARNFLPDKGAKFSTYASYWIRSRIQKFIPNGRRAISIPLRHNYLKAKLELYRKEHRNAGIEEIAKALGHLPGLMKDVDKKVKVFPLAPCFLNIPCENEEYCCDKKELGWLLSSDCLTDIERVVLIYRFGVNGNDPLSLNDIGRKLGRTREGIRLMEQEALLKLRKQIEE